ncbi:MAG: MOSC domain-containing protein [Acidimicrobiales bacterium]
MTPSPHTLGTIAELWRYPIKSLGGERLERCSLDLRGLCGDRSWAIVGNDGKIGSGKTTKRFRRMSGLLDLSASSQKDDVPLISFPDGIRARGDHPSTPVRISELLGEEVSLRQEAEVSHHDDSPVHIITTGSLAWLQSRHPEVAIDARRFRPNIVIQTSEPWEEESWTRHAIRLGDAVLRPFKVTERCVMITMAQPGITFSPRLLGDLERQHDGSFGIYAQVVTPGELRLGDSIELIDD